MESTTHHGMLWLLGCYLYSSIDSLFTMALITAAQQILDEHKDTVVASLHEETHTELLPRR
jgi:hypothetical protein